MPELHLPDDERRPATSTRHKPSPQSTPASRCPDKQFTNSGNRKMGFRPRRWAFRPGGQRLMISDYSASASTDKLALLRSCHTDSHAHGSAWVAMNTGSTFIGRPSLGSWAVYGLGTTNQSLPGYVAIMDKRGGPISGQPNWPADSCRPVTGHVVPPGGEPVLDLRGPLDARSREQPDLPA
jgi:hypothetical protein